jgi:hypothetical protein
MNPPDINQIKAYGELVTMGLGLISLLINAIVPLIPKPSDQEKMGKIKTFLDRISMIPLGAFVAKLPSSNNGNGQKN